MHFPKLGRIFEFLSIVQFYKESYSFTFRTSSINFPYNFCMLIGFIFFYFSYLSGNAEDIKVGCKEVCWTCEERTKLQEIYISNKTLNALSR